MSAFERTRIAGLQKPHCRAPWAAKESAYRLRSSSEKPSSVVTSEPSTLSRDVEQLTHTKDRDENSEPADPCCPHRLANAVDREPLGEASHTPNHIDADEEHSQQR